MKKLSKLLVACAAVLLGMGTSVFADGTGPDYSALSTAIGTGATAVTTVATTAIVAGFGIFVLIWGARKIKGALSSGA